MRRCRRKTAKSVLCNILHILQYAFKGIEMKYSLTYKWTQYALKTSITIGQNLGLNIFAPWSHGKSKTEIFNIGDSTKNETIPEERRFQTRTLFDCNYKNAYKKTKSKMYNIHFLLFLIQQTNKRKKNYQIKTNQIAIKSYIF